MIRLPTRRFAEMPPEVRNKSALARARAYAQELVTEFKYSEDQPRDAHGRFGSGGGVVTSPPKTQAWDRLNAAFPNAHGRIDLHGIDPKIATTIADRMGKFADEFPGAARTVAAITANNVDVLHGTAIGDKHPEVFGPEFAMEMNDPNSAAMTGSTEGQSVVLFNPDQFSSESRFAELAGAMEPGDHPLGVYTPAEVVDHEMGHVLEYSVGQGHTGLVNGVEKEMELHGSTIGTYATIGGPGEAFGEAFMVRQAGKEDILNPGIRSAVDDVVAAAKESKADRVSSSGPLRLTCRDMFKPRPKSEQKADPKADVDFLTHWNKQVDRWEGQVHDTITRFVERHKKVTLAKLGGSKARKDTRHWNPPGTKTLNPKTVVNDKRWRDELTTDMKALLEKMVAEMGSEAFDKIMERVKVELRKKVAPYDSAPPFEDAPYAPYSVVDQQVVPNFPGGLKEFNDQDPNIGDMIEARSQRLADFSDRMSQDIRDTVAEGERQGRSIDEIAQDLNDRYGNSEFWADRIAQTEVNGAMNATSMTAAAQTGVIGDKVWNAVEDEHTRKDHSDADGQTVPFDEPFDIGGTEMEHPGDENAPADEVINCRCVVTFSTDPEKLAGPDPEIPQ